MQRLRTKMKWEYVARYYPNAKGELPAVDLFGVGYVGFLRMVSANTEAEARTKARIESEERHPGFPVTVILGDDIEESRR